MRLYYGYRDAQGTAHVRVAELQPISGVIFTSGNRPLDPRLDLANKSPSGFEWGYPGSGPMQLSLALCADALGDDKRALALFNEFTWLVTRSFERDQQWVLSDVAVVKICEALAQPSAALGVI